LTAKQEAEAVTELRRLAGGRADLLAEHALGKPYSCGTSPRTRPTCQPVSPSLLAATTNAERPVRHSTRGKNKAALVISMDFLVLNLLDISILLMEVTCFDRKGDRTEILSPRLSCGG
jgi:hypothetical protein